MGCSNKTILLNCLNKQDYESLESELPIDSTAIVELAKPPSILAKEEEKETKPKASSSPEVPPPNNGGAISEETKKTAKGKPEPEKKIVEKSQENFYRHFIFRREECGWRRS